MIYLDNAATSWPKPEAVYRAADAALRGAANPGRGGHHLSREAARKVLAAREDVASFFGVKDCRQLVFTGGATDSLNMVIQGYGPNCQRILATGFEHNSVWRPLEHVAEVHGVKVDYISGSPGEDFDWDQFCACLSLGPELVVVTHASNITGDVWPLEAIISKAHQSGALVCADIAQTAGFIPVDLGTLGVDFAAFPGHKGLLGPPGIGGLYVRERDSLPPRNRGGTGSGSELSRQPDELPDRLESGTLNLPGIVGLGAGIRYIREAGLASVAAHKQFLTAMAREGLRALGVQLYGKDTGKASLLAFNIGDLDSAEAAFMLDEIYRIAVRGGIHCCPRGHGQLGTLDQGAIRISPGIFNTASDIKTMIEAVAAISEQYMR